MSQFIEMFGTLDDPKVKVSKLIDVVVSSGQYGSNTSATDYQEGKLRYIRITDINDDGSLNDDIKTAEVIDDKYRLESGDIVFARTGATVGKTYLHEAGDAIYAGYLIKYQMNSEFMKPLFMKAFTHSKTYYNWVANSQKVGAQPNISATQYDQMPVLVPSVDEQEAFLKIYQQADKSKFAYFKSQFIEMFGNFAANKNKWNVSPLGDVVKEIISGECLNGNQRPMKIGEKAVLKVSAVSWGEFNESEYKVLNEDVVVKKGIYPKKGDLLFCRANTPENVGGTALIDKDYPDLYLPDKIWKIIPVESLTTLYLKYYMSTAEVRSIITNMASGTSNSMYNISMAKLKTLPILVPDMELQTQFALIVKQADKSKSQVLMALQKTEFLLQYNIRQVA